MPDKSKDLTNVPLPSLDDIIAEYGRQEKKITREQAESILDSIKEDAASGHIDAMENLINDHLLEGVCGGVIGPTPTEYAYKDDEEAHEDMPSCIIRPN